MLLFVATASVGYWVSYNREVALVKFLVILGAVFVYYLVVNMPAFTRSHITTILTILATLLSLYFLFTHDWRTVPAGIRFIDNLGDRWMRIRPISGESVLHPNIIAGILATLIPFTIALALAKTKFRRNLVLIAIIAIGLFMTGSRGAWLALSAALVVWIWWHISGKRRQVFVLVCLAAMVLSIVVLWASPNILLALANRLPGVASGSSRLELYQNTLALAPDYLLTGGGLGAFAGLYSYYVLILPTEVFTYAHNLYLDILIEQGIGGLFAWLGIIAGTFWLILTHLFKEDAHTHLRWATFASLLIIISHGLVDDALYGNWGTPLLFIVPAIAVALTEIPNPKSTIRNPALALTPPILLILFVALSPTGRALWYANQGTMAMAQVELADFPTNKWQEGQHLSDYDVSIAYFNQAVQANSANRTAHFRLGLVAMIYRNYDIAVEELEMASGLGGRENAGIQKALAYSYLWNNQPDQAQILLTQLPESRRELRNYVGWWQTQGREDFSQLAAQMLAQIEPSN